MKKLIVKKAKFEDTRRGWVRISKKDRDYFNINLDSLIKIKYGDQSVYRLVYGCIKKEEDVDKFPKEGEIALDEATRTKLRINENYIGKPIEFNIENQKFEIFYKFCYYWNHPDNYISFSFSVSLTLGILSVILAILGFILK